MLPLPHHPCDIALPQPVHADSQAFVHFDSNLYSVPSDTWGLSWGLSSEGIRTIPHMEFIVTSLKKTILDKAPVATLSSLYQNEEKENE